MNWYYDQGGERQGPVDDTTLDQLIATGVVRAETLVWREGMDNWAPLSQARPSAAATGGAAVPEGWIRCTATGRYFPPSEIVYIDGKPYSAEAKAGVVQGVLQSGELPLDPDTHRTGPPWEHREELGKVKAIWETMKGALFEPHVTFSNMKRTGGLGAPYIFFLICSVLGMLVMLTLIFLFLMPVVLTAIKSAQAQSGGGNANLAAAGTIGVVVFIFYAVLLLGSCAIMPFVNGGIVHLCLMLVKGARYPFETTFRAWCYAQGSAMLLLIVPGCGWGVAGIWAIVATCIAMARAHEINTGRAVAAVLLPIGICCVLDIGLQVMIALMSSAGQN